MPEEINRVVTDRLSSLLFTTEPSANENLRSEGIREERIHFVGNVMIDTLLAHRDRARGLGVPARLGPSPREYALVRLHRPSNVDEPGTLGLIARALAWIVEKGPVVFPAHPRTRQNLTSFKMASELGETRLIDPLGTDLGSCLSARS